VDEAKPFPPKLLPSGLKLRRSLKLLPVVDALKLRFQTAWQRGWQKVEIEQR
jgi:hypothetical protein